MPTQGIGTAQVIVPAAGYYSELENPSALETEVLYGERLHLLDHKGSYFLAHSDFYSKPGWVERKIFETGYTAPTHRVRVPFAHVYHGVGFKTGRLCTLSFNAQVYVIGGAPSPDGQMLQLDSLGWVFNHQLIGMAYHVRDFVEFAELRIGTPYMWGGRMYPDCSALLMDALIACGLNCPRNVSEQVVQLGVPVEFEQDFSNLRRGDLVFWTDPNTKGRHVVIMTSARKCVHSTIAEPYRSVVEQDLSVVIRDQEHDGNGRPTMVRRLPHYRYNLSPAA